MFKKLFGSDDSDLNLTNKDFLAKIKEGDAILIDVRTREEFNEGHIPGAVNIDFYEDYVENISNYDKERKYLLYCRSGSRSYSALKIMKNQGFQNVSHLDSGIIGWDQTLVNSD